MPCHNDSTMPSRFEVDFGCLILSLVPYDKFRPSNIEKVWEYLEHVSRISPERLKYGDKKSLKGKEIFNKLEQRDVLTGLVPQAKTDPDLQNTYSIIGLCGICTRSTPVRNQITDTIVDADLFLWRLSHRLQ